MLKFIQRTSKKAGSAPGTLVHVGETRTQPVGITVIDYDAESLDEREVRDTSEILPLRDSPTATWIDVDGIHELEIVRAIGRRFDIHPLTLEDVVNTGQRPKSEDFEGYVYFVFKMLRYDPVAEEIRAEQVSLILGPRYLISLQEEKGDVFAPVRERLRRGRGRLRKSGCGYLAYALIDAVVDGYFSILERIGEKIEALEEPLMAEPDPQTIQMIHALKRELIFMRKQVWPLREMIGGLVKGEFELLPDSLEMYFNDVHDHTIQVIDTVESYRDLLSGMLDLYLSTVSNRMNEVMKLLTIIATIFIPLTFLAGVYGMNFKHMPELQWRWGYPLVWAVMGLLGLGLVLYFKRKKWL